MDLVWEFRAVYGPLDPERDSWAAFLSGVAATARFTARQLYAAIVGPSFALAGLSGDGAGDRHQLHETLRAAAFPMSAQPMRRLIVGPDEA